MTHDGLRQIGLLVVVSVSSHFGDHARGPGVNRPGAESVHPCRRRWRNRHPAVEVLLKPGPTLRDRSRPALCTSEQRDAIDGCNVVVRPLNSMTRYRSAHAGGPQPVTGTDFAVNIQGVAPYWRLAWQQSFGVNYLEVGTLGMHVSTVPNGVSGSRDTYTDPELDMQFERPSA